MDNNYTRKLNRAKVLVNQIKDGKDPINNIDIREDSFLKDNKMQNLLLFISEVIDNEIYAQMPKVGFYITANEVSSIEVPKDIVTITEFTDAVNKSIKLKNRKKLIPTNLTSVLRKLNELEYVLENDKKRTRATALGKANGILEIESGFQGREYMKICYGKKGIKHLQDILLEYFSDDDF